MRKGGRGGAAFSDLSRGNARVAVGVPWIRTAVRGDPGADWTAVSVSVWGPELFSVQKRGKLLFRKGEGTSSGRGQLPRDWGYGAGDVKLYQQIFAVRVSGGAAGRVLNDCGRASGRRCRTGGAVRGRVTGISPVTFLNIRIAHERKGSAKAVWRFIRERDTVYNTLILSAPGAGKTTMLRDLVRAVSDGELCGVCKKTGVVDERCEIAAADHGVPQTDLGPVHGCAERLWQDGRDADALTVDVTGGACCG